MELCKIFNSETQEKSINMLFDLHLSQEMYDEYGDGQSDKS